MKRRTINPWPWQDSFGFVPANKISGVGRTSIGSGWTCLDTQARVTHQGDMAARITGALDSLETMLDPAGFPLRGVIRLNWYTTDVDIFRQSAAFLLACLAKAGRRAATALLGVARFAYPELLVEVEATAAA